jgi:hypothetical protein
VPVSAAAFESRDAEQVDERASSLLGGVSNNLQNSPAKILGDDQ